jgi:hypothetical protein
MNLKISGFPIMPGGTVKPPGLLHIKLLNSSWITLSRELKMLSGQMLNKCQHFGLINLIIPGKVIGHPSFIKLLHMNHPPSANQKFVFLV